MKIKHFAIGVIAIIGIMIFGSLFGVAGAGTVLATVPLLGFLDSIPDLTEKERKFATGLINQINELQKNATLGLVKEDYVATEIKKLTDQLAEVKGLQSNNNFQTQLDALTIQIKGLENKNNPQVTKSIAMQLKDALTPEIFQKLRNKEKVNLELKLANTMSITSNTTGEVARVEHTPGMVWLPESQPMLQNIIPSIPTNSNSVSITEAYDEQGAPIFMLEGNAGGQMSWKWREKNFAVKDVSVWSKFSRNIMDDVDNFIGQIQNKLFLRLDKKYDEKLMFGNEGVNPEEFDGLTHIATAFNNNGVKTYSPTERDVIVAAVAQLEEADFMGDFVVINPRDKFKLKVAKAGKDNAILQFQDFPQTLEGLRVITSTRMTAGKFLVGDSTKALQHIRLGFEMTLGDQDADNLTKRLLTVVMTKRAAFEISANYYGAFVYGDFTTAKAAMTLTT